MNKIGLVGCGNWGRNILRDLISLGCQVQVVDIDPQARLIAVSKGANQAVAALDDLPVCDGFVVAVPIPELMPQTARLLKFKKPVFCEKTLCISLKDIAVLKNSNGANYIYCMHKWHYHPGIEALRQVSLSGSIGEIEELVTIRHGWVDDFHGGDAFWTLAVHDLTIVKHIIDYIPVQIQVIEAIKSEAGLPFSVLAVIGRKPVVSISVNGRHCQKKSFVSLHGSRGSAMLEDAYDGYITLHNVAGEKKIPIDTTFPLFLELKEFVEYLNGGPPPRCNFSHAEEVTLALISLRNGIGLPSEYNTYRTQQ